MKMAFKRAYNLNVAIAIIRNTKNKTKTCEVKEL